MRYCTLLSAYGVLVAFVLIILASGVLILGIGGVAATNQTSDDQVERAFSWLADLVEDNWGNSEENSLSVLALKNYNYGLAKQGASELLDESSGESGECWPAGSCKVKDTAIALIALWSMGEDTSKIEAWLENQEINSLQEGEWLLQTDLAPNGSCTIAYSYAGEEKIDTVFVAEDKTVSLEKASFCFEDAVWWLRFKDSCLDKEFLVDCSADEEYVINLRLDIGNKIFIFPETINEGATIKIKNKCFPSLPAGQACNYEATKWASLALYLAKGEVNTLAFLESEADTFKPLSYAFIFMLKDDFGFSEKLLSEQKPAGYWNTDRFFKTAIAVLSLKGVAAENISSAEEWLLDNQNSEGSWGTQKRRDTSAVLWAVFSKPDCGNGRCEAHLGEDRNTCSKDCAGGLDYCADVGYVCCITCEGDGLEIAEYSCPEGKICCEECEIGEEETDCADGLDDDGDGRIDCEDSDCDGIGKCEYLREVTCNDFFDNDGDGYEDCQDDDCCIQTMCEGIGACEVTVEICTDGFDNDGDGLTDCEDFDCESAEVCKKGFPWGWLLLVIVLIAAIAVAAYFLLKKRGAGKGKPRVGFFPPRGPPRRPLPMPGRPAGPGVGVPRSPRRSPAPARSVPMFPSRMPVRSRSTPTRSARTARPTRTARTTRAARERGRKASTEKELEKTLKELEKI